MEPVLRQRLRQALLALGQATASPVQSAICSGLGSGESPACEALFDQFFRIISAANPSLPTFLAALHHLALTGEAPALARFFPSCGGSFDPATDGQALHQAVEASLRERREEVLDFLLSGEPRNPEVRRAAAVLLGAQAAAAQFGGGLSLVQLGPADGLLLQFDRYAYALGEQHLGQSPLTLSVAATGPIPSRPLPAIRGRRGLGEAPADLGDPAERLRTAAFVPPDDLARLARFHAACQLAETADPADPVDLRQGIPDLDFPRLLAEAYQQMAPGNTLFLFSVGAWSLLRDEEQKRLATGLQRFAAQVQPHKPIAWLQVEPFTPGQPTLELRLHTFGWADLEDRAVIRLAEAAPDLAWIRWLT